jgi:phosphoribosyl 1,2-cyclic phosphate phosphodiesterase
MKVHFLGTAAAEGIPSLFCRCETCRQATQRGGKNIRTRTSVMIDDVLKIDFPPDTYFHMIRDGLDLETVQDLVITHSHSDHLLPEDLYMRLPGFAQSEDRPIHVYGHDRPIGKCIDVVGNAQKKFAFHVVQPFVPVRTQTAVIVPLLADHDKTETCLLYYIEKDGKTMLYGHDSGWFPEATLNWLKDKKLDLAILECTTGRKPCRNNHMDIDCTVETKEWLAGNGVLKPDAQVTVTHFSHNAHMLHEDFVAAFEPHGITVAYDGMILHI